MPAFRNHSVLNRITDRTSFFIYMRACRKFALPEIRLKLPKTVKQLIFQYRFTFHKIKGRKSGRIGNITAANFIKLTVAGRVPASAKFFTCFAGLERKIRIYGV